MFNTVAVIKMSAIIPVKPQIAILASIAGIKRHQRFRF
jgi:hypothetical protein